MSIWDEWSHYNRFMIRRFRIPWNLANSVKISLTDREPDYSKCRREGITWPERKLWIVGWTVEIP
jgi:hypothetical protein